MEKIIFSDYPNTDSSLNAVNLNQMQDNVENAINGEVLYESSGKDDSFTLTKSATGYKYIEVFYTSDGIYQSAKFDYQPDVKFSTTNIFTNGESNIEYIYNTTWKINGDKITRIATRNNFLTPDNNVGSFGSSAYILIYKVVGYK